MYFTDMNVSLKTKAAPLPTAALSWGLDLVATSAYHVHVEDNIPMETSPAIWGNQTTAMTLTESASNLKAVINCVAGTIMSVVIFGGQIMVFSVVAKDSRLRT